MIKRIVTILSAVALAVTVQAQNRVTEYTSRLNLPDPSTGASVRVTNDSDVNASLRTSVRAEQVNGYRIMLMSDNTQNGRNLASSAVARFRSEFPGIPVNMPYEPPTFYVFAGYYLTRMEAVMMAARFQRVFPRAQIRNNEKFPLAELIQTPAQEFETEEETVSEADQSAE